MKKIVLRKMLSTVTIRKFSFEGIIKLIYPKITIGPIMYEIKILGIKKLSEIVLKLYIINGNINIWAEIATENGFIMFLLIFRFL